MTLLDFEVSPILIPLAGIGVAIVAVAGGIISQMHSTRIKADQRMALIARGLSAKEIEGFLKTDRDTDPRGPKDPLRSLGTARRAATVLISLGLGLVAFFCLIALIIGQREIYTGAACGLIPLFIGFGFVVDYQLQKREMSRFGLEIEQESAPRA
jgi:hypothetical protein